MTNHQDFPVPGSPLRAHIGLNAHLLSLGQNYRNAGISWYIYNLVLNLGQRTATDSRFQFSVFLHDRRFQAEAELSNRALSLHHSRLPTNRPLLRILWEQLFQPVMLRRVGLDLYHALAFVAPIAISCPFVITVYDLSSNRFPEAFRPLHRFYLRTFTAHSAKRAKAIITISESTRQDVIRFLDIPAEKVHTIYCGVDPSFQVYPQAEVEAFKARHRLPEKFILFLGTLEPRKNISGLIKAYAAWCQADLKAPKLIIGGGKGWYYQHLFTLVEQLNLTDRVIFPGYLAQEELPLWYNAATMFVYPSHFEGFGLPVLEAMACGTPVITSTASSLPEVAGQAGVLIEPTDVEGLSAAMAGLFNDTARRQRLAQQGLTQSRTFNWRKTAAETMQVYEQVL